MMRIYIAAVPLLMLCAIGCSRSESPTEAEPVAKAETNVPWITIETPTVIVSETVEIVEPDPHEMERQRVQGMALIDDRPRELETAQPEN